MQGVWKPHRAKFTSGEEYWIGQICVGCYCWHSRSKSDPVSYHVVIALPHITMKTGEFQPTQEAARERLERAVNTWFRWLNEPVASIKAPKGE